MTFQTDRRKVITGLGATVLLSGCASVGGSQALLSPGVTITIDDFDLYDTPIYSALERDAAILSALDTHGVTAWGFVAGKYLSTDSAQHVLHDWTDKGHSLGNHSFSHKRFTGADPCAFMQDILRCDELLSPYPSYRKVFRFPYLAEGETSAGRDAMRALLQNRSFRNGHVTIDTSDWYIDNRLRQRLKDDAAPDLQAYRDFYLEHIWERATYYDGLARALLGHSIHHTLLLHHRLVTSLFLDNLLRMFRDRGWSLVDAAGAFTAPLYQENPDSVPAGQSLLWAMAKGDPRLSASLRFPGENDVYEKPRMDTLGL